MMTLRERIAPLRAVASPAPNLGAWLAAWPMMRGELEALIAAYEQQCPGFHRQWTMSLVDSVDDSLRTLGHRVTWLHERLASSQGDMERIED